MAITGRTATVAESASATSVTGTRPADRQAGDYVIAHFAMTCTVAQFTGPGGSWTQLVAPTVDSANVSTVAVYGMFDPPSNPAASMSAVAGRVTCLMQAYGGVDPSNPVDVAAVTSTGTLPLTVTQVTTVTAGARLISGTTANFSTGTWTQPASMTLVKTHTSGTGRGAAIADEDRPTAGATGTRQWTASVLQGAAGYLLALRPASTSPAAAVPQRFFPPGRARRLKQPRRGGFFAAVPVPVVTTPPAFVPAPLTARRRPAQTRRGEYLPLPLVGAAPTPPPPFPPPYLEQTHTRPPVLRRGRFLTVPLAGATPATPSPVIPPLLTHRTYRPLTRRGRFLTAPPPQTPAPGMLAGRRRPPSTRPRGARLFPTPYIVAPPAPSVLRPATIRATPRRPARRQARGQYLPLYLVGLPPPAFSPVLVGVDNTTGTGSALDGGSAAAGVDGSGAQVGGLDGAAAGTGLDGSSAPC